MRPVQFFYAFFIAVFLGSCGGNGLSVRFDDLRGMKKASELVDYEKLKKESPYPVIGSPDAVRGGSLTVSMQEFPSSFNAFVNNYVHVAAVFGMVYESLMITHPLTLQPVPLLASSYEISPDKKTFTFHIDPNAKWSDGKSVTAGDVLFTYNLIMNPTNMTSLLRVSLRYFYAPEVRDDHTVVFKVKNDHWNNFMTAYTFTVLPEHIFKGRNFNRDFNMNLPGGSGPYALSEVRKGRFIKLKYRPDYWGRSLPINFGAHNFDSIRFVSIMDPFATVNYLKKGEIDSYAVYMSKLWIEEFNVPVVEKNWLKKQKIFNYQPRGFQGLCFNLRRDLFGDLRVRQAIACLINQKLLIKKLMYNEYDIKTSYWPFINGNNTTNPFYEYNIEKARALLQAAGWKAGPDGILMKDGKRFEFKLLYSDKSLERHFTIFIEDFKKAGIQADLDLVSFSTYTKRMDDYQFDAVWQAYGTGLFPDPESMWSSREADQKAGNNVAGFKDPRADALIEQMKTIYDPLARNEILKKLDALVYSQMPYVIFWNADNSRILYWDKFGFPEGLFTKYGNEYDIMTWWWVSPEKEKVLKAALRANKALPTYSPRVWYDKSLEERFPR